MWTGAWEGVRGWDGQGRGGQGRRLWSAEKLVRPQVGELQVTLLSAASSFADVSYG